MDAPPIATRTCCNRPMTGLQVGRPAVVLHTCGACGMHRWTREGVEVDRVQLLDALTPRAEPPPPGRALTPAARRAALRTMLEDFRPHGESS